MVLFASTISPVTHSNNFNLINLIFIIFIQTNIILKDPSSFRSISEFDAVSQGSALNETRTTQTTSTEVIDTVRKFIINT